MKTFNVQYAFGDRVTYDILKVRAKDAPDAIRKAAAMFKRDHPNHPVQIGQADPAGKGSKP